MKTTILWALTAGAAELQQLVISLMSPNFFACSWSCCGGKMLCGAHLFADLITQRRGEGPHTVSGRGLAAGGSVIARPSSTGARDVFGRLGVYWPTPCVS